LKKLFLAIAFIVLWATPSYANELLMFSNPNCGYCQKFLEEVEPTYNESEVGKVLPLHIIQMDQPVPDWYINAFKAKAIGRIAGTPTFIVWINDREVHRIVGYQGKGWFYNQLGEWLRVNQHQLNADPNAPPFLGKQNNDQWNPQLPEFGERANELDRGEGSHSKHLELKREVPEGVIDSDNIFDHTYDTPELALKAAKHMDCFPNVHYHPKEAVWMPCSMVLNSGSEEILKQKGNK